MGAQISRRQFVIASASVAGAALCPAAAHADDAEAWRRVDAMLAQNGGRDRWAEARTLFLEYRQYYAGDRPAYREERAWRDMQAPRERMEFFSPAREGVNERRYGRGFTDGEMWQRNVEGAVSSLDARETREYLDFWSRDFYTMFARFARRDAALSARMAAGHRIEVSDDGAPIGVWRIDGAGNLISWEAPFSATERLSYLYGPPHQFGDMRYIGWGMAAAGDFRFEYARVALSREPMAPELTADRSAAVATPWR